MGERSVRALGEEGEASLRVKLARASQLLFFKRHREPGARGWELRRHLGRNYLEIIKLLDQEIQRIGLKVQEVPEGEDPDSSRFYVVMKEQPMREVRMFGWRIDDMAMLAVTLAYVLSRQGKAPLSEVLKVLDEKFPRWRAERALDRFIKGGYLTRDGRDILYIGWRSRAEVDQKLLLTLLLGRGGVGAGEGVRGGEAEAGTGTNYE
ncbi:MAG: hypothetical protein QW390_00120 [Candidatus Bathyarchaeia archaeon]